ncbi:MAG: peptidoglycan DD-metalloendopeptidase family protein [Desulfobacterales bacterium]|nr:peptidoglycan DD-metalloendopeptidase family protein [Desulfobacterales bacterium]
MKKRIKIWFHSGGSSDIREVSLRKPFALLFVFFNIGAIAGLSYLGYDYYQLKKIAFDNDSLNQKIVSQTGEILSQRKQVQTFAKEIEVLKEQVRSLATLEDQVRLIADIQKTGNSSGLIGIGGIPENDLDQDLPLETRHNNLIREMHQQVDQTQTAAAKKTLDFEDLINKLEKKKNLLASTPSIKPVDGWITSRFGYRKSPFTGKRSFHSGLDISNRPGTKIITTANGKVTYAARKMYFGNLVVIDHGYGKVTKYAHCKEILVKRGQKVKRGEVIATVGNTGQSTGPHLHYEVRINGAPVNPLKYILN